MRIALAHDWLVGLRGGELVLDRIARVAGELGEVTRLYTMFDDGRGLTPAIDGVPRTVAGVGRLGPGGAWSNRWRRWLFPLYARAVEELSARLADDHARAPVDLVISTSSAAMKGLAAPQGVPHVCYCHTPARYAWSQAGEYGGSVARAAGLAVYGPVFRRWDRRTASRVGRFMANSWHTAREIARCYGRGSVVAHPPVRTAFFTPDAGTERGEHWLLVGALEPYKRVELAIGASRASGVPLRIVGDGSAGARLRELAAGSPVTFVGRVSDEALREEYRRARLLVFPQVEDFGIVAVEAQACGTPVVARRAGGALDSVIEHRTGALFTDATVGALCAAAGRCPEDAAACRANAERFSEARFDAALRREIDKAMRGERDAVGEVVG